MKVGLGFIQLPLEQLENENWSNRSWTDLFGSHLKKPRFASLLLVAMPGAPNSFLLFLVPS